MRVLVACEYSARVRDAFRAKGHDAWSCDLRECEGDPSWHIQGDAIECAYDMPWDLMIGHPPCTYLTNAGVQWLYHPDDTHLNFRQRRRHPSYPNRLNDFLDGAKFFNRLKSAPIDRICLENSIPSGVAMMIIGRYTQIVQPWHVGSPFTKGAALWLKNLPMIAATHSRSDYDEITPACHRMPPGPDREKNRSRTDPAIAIAMANSWG